MTSFREVSGLKRVIVSLKVTTNLGRDPSEKNRMCTKLRINENLSNNY